MSRLKTVAYFYSSHKQDDMKKMEADVLALSKRHGVKEPLQLNDVTRGYNWLSRPSWDSIRVGVATRGVSMVVLNNLYSIDRNHTRIVHFLQMCRRRDCKVYFTEYEWWNKAQEEEPAKLDEYIRVINVIAKHIVDYRSNSRYSVTRKKLGRKTIPTQCKNKIIQSYKEGKSVKWIVENCKYTKNSNYYKVSRRMVYYIIEAYKKQEQAKNERK